MSVKPQSLHWLEKVRDDIFTWKKTEQVTKLHVDDMKTPSGRVHTGALRGVVLHDLVAKSLRDQDPSTVSTYVFNDMDPMDGLPAYLDKAEYEPHMGKPLFKIPAPPIEKSGVDLTKASPEELDRFKNAKNFAEFYAFDFIDAFRKLGCDQELVWSHEIYQSGKMDSYIRLALDNIEIIRKVYQEVADYKLPERWYPFQVICPQCGKVGTTLTTDWDGEQVTFECQPNKVTWAVGCGYTGKTSPFGGTGKLLWKMDWPAHWAALGITIEGAGKDHTSAGGSRDMANHIVGSVFKHIVPFDIPYEWILIRGAKMSSSKGVGTSAREFVELFPPEVGRFLFTDKPYGQVIDFDPQTMAIPDLFDEYDQGARVFWGQEAGDQRLGISFKLSQIGQVPEAHFLPRFRDVARWMQHPEINLGNYFAEIKGSALTDLEKQVLAERQGFAEVWVERYAPEEYKLRPTPEIPAAAETLTTEQRTFLTQANDLIDSRDPWEPQELQQALFDLAKNSVGSRPAFEAIYLAFLGKKAGPKAAWFLLSIEPKMRNERIEALGSLKTASKGSVFESLSRSDILTISEDVKAAYPSITLGVAIIKGVSISKTNPDLEIAKQELAESLKNLTNETIGAFSEVQSYRQLYRDMKVDWHSRRPSPEALMRRLAQGKNLYTINTCVDAYNLAVLKHRVSIGAFDLDKIQFPTSLEIAKGGEQILLLGDDEPTTLKAGEISYFDQEGPYNLDYNYRDAQRTMVTESTTNLLINIDGVYDIDRDHVEQSLRETIDLIQKYCGGTVELVGIVEATS